MRAPKTWHPNHAAWTLFWSRVNIQPGFACWAWTGAASKFGYGILPPTLARAFGDRHAHRIAARRRWGAFSDFCSGLIVLHNCDNPRCCNPRHLYWGTHIANSHDKELASWALLAVSARAKGEPDPHPMERVLPSPGRTWEVIRKEMA